MNLSNISAIEEIIKQEENKHNFQEEKRCPDVWAALPFILNTFTILITDVVYPRPASYFIYKIHTFYNISIFIYFLLLNSVLIIIIIFYTTCNVLESIELFLTESC